MNPLPFFFNGHTILLFLFFSFSNSNCCATVAISNNYTVNQVYMEKQITRVLVFGFFLLLFLCLFCIICFRNIKTEKKEVMKDSQVHLL